MSCGDRTDRTACLDARHVSAPITAPAASTLPRAIGGCQGRSWQSACALGLWRAHCQAPSLVPCGPHGYTLHRLRLRPVAVRWCCVPLKYDVLRRLSVERLSLTAIIVFCSLLGTDCHHPHLPPSCSSAPRLFCAFLNSLSACQDPCSRSLVHCWNDTVPVPPSPSAAAVWSGGSSCWG